ncbi:hypothetical protein J3A78_006439 [Streptomyces sp. PvR006]|nr:hypothetical protein [Streptomyces sp. PvR006]
MDDALPRGLVATDQEARRRLRRDGVRAGAGDRRSI